MNTSASATTTAGALNIGSWRGALNCRILPTSILAWNALSHAGTARSMLRHARAGAMTGSRFVTGQAPRPPRGEDDETCGLEGALRVLERPESGTGRPRAQRCRTGCDPERSRRHVRARVRRRNRISLPHQRIAGQRPVPAGAARVFVPEALA